MPANYHCRHAHLTATLPVSYSSITIDGVRWLMLLLTGTDAFIRRRTPAVTRGDDVRRNTFGSATISSTIPYDRFLVLGDNCYRHLRLPRCMRGVTRTCVYGRLTHAHALRTAIRAHTHATALPRVRYHWTGVPPTPAPPTPTLDGVALRAHTRTHAHRDAPVTPA